MKTCTKCGVTQPLDNFSNKKRYPDGKNGQCKSCCRAYTLSHKFKIDFDLADQLASVKSCRCCGERLKGSLDRQVHHLDTDKGKVIRGVVCRQCNNILGDESPLTLKKIEKCLAFSTNN